MRMEHKSPLPDIEFSPSPRPFESSDRFENKTKPFAEVVLVPPAQHQQPPPPHHQFGITEYDQTSGLKTFENIRYTTFDAAAPKEAHIFVQEKPLSEAFMGSPPKVNYSSVSQRVKTLEHFEDGTPLFKSHPVWNASNESPPVRHFNSEKPIQTEMSPSIYQTNGRPNSVNETLEKISNKMQEYEQTRWLKDYDLKAPGLVKHATPNVNHLNGYKTKDESFAQPLLNMKPGETPEFCYAPRVTSERKPSLVERIEKSLERELEKGPSKVLPHSVRTIPPSPQTVSTETTFESSKRSVILQAKEPEINEHHKDFGHIKNNFYEHNKPLPRKDHIPTPIQAPQVRNMSVFVCVNL